MFSSPDSQSSAQISLPSRHSRARPVTVFGSSPTSKLRSITALAQLRMGEVKIVLPLHDVVRVLVAQREAHAQDIAAVANDVQADDFHFLAAIECVAGQFERFFRRDDAAPVTLVEPFRRSADLARARLAALHAPLEHLHGVGQLGFLLLDLDVHGVARSRAAQMRQPGTGDQATVGIGMIERRQQPVRSSTHFLVACGFRAGLVAGRGFQGSLARAPPQVPGRKCASRRRARAVLRHPPKRRPPCGAPERSLN